MWSLSQLLDSAIRAKAATDNMKANEHGWVRGKMCLWVLSVIVTGFSDVLTYSSFDFFSTFLKKMWKPYFDCWLYKLPEYHQLTGIHKNLPLLPAPFAKSTHLSQGPYNFPWGPMFGMSGLLKGLDFTDLSPYCAAKSISLQKEHLGLKWAG